MGEQDNTNTNSKNAKGEFRVAYTSIGFAIGAGVTALYTTFIAPLLSPTIEIPRNTPKVAEGFVNPSNIKKIDTADLDLDGKVDATIIQYEKQTLLFKVSKTYDGKVKLEANPFEISEKK